MIFPDRFYLFLLPFQAIVDDVKIEADAIYNLVNTLPAFYDPHAKSLRMAWTEEKEILIKTIKQLKEIVTQKPVSYINCLSDVDC